jgi:hypothetical protein
MRFMSVWATAMLAAKTAVIAPTQATTCSAPVTKSAPSGCADIKGQPDVQGHLAGLADGAAEDQQGDARRDHHAQHRRLRDQSGERGVFEAAAAAVEEQ